MATTSVYLHFPWCTRKCPYCDFATRPVGPELPHEAYADAVLRELDLKAPGLADRTLESVFFGGGTPSLWQGAQLGRVLKAIRAAFGREVDELEITAESNPASLTEARAMEFAEAGINRLSVGVQSLDDDRLKFLGRLHDRTMAIGALEIARRAVPRVSADLMFGLPEQSTEEFVAAAEELRGLGLTHLSTYALTIEPQTPFGALHRKGKLPLAKEDVVAETFDRLRDALGQAGFQHYEVSNHAIEGETSKHNQHYWRGGAYVGLGAGAVGAMDEGVRVRRTKNTIDPKRYMDAGGIEEEEVIEGDELIQEGLMLGLRTAEGVHLPALEARAGVPWSRGREAAIERRREAGDLVLENDRLKVPTNRWLFLDGIVADLF